MRVFVECRLYLHNWIKKHREIPSIVSRRIARACFARTTKLIKYLSKQLYTCRDNKNHNDLFFLTAACQSHTEKNTQFARQQSFFSSSLQQQHRVFLYVRFFFFSKKHKKVIFFQIRVPRQIYQENLYKKINIRSILKSVLTLRLFERCVAVCLSPQLSLLIQRITTCVFVEK